MSAGFEDGKRKPGGKEGSDIQKLVKARKGFSLESP